MKHVITFFSLFIFTSCAHLNPGGSRSAKQLMPEMEGALKLISINLKAERPWPQPERHIENIKALLKELTDSSSKFYTDDSQTWKRYAVLVLDEVNKMESNWRAGLINEAKRSFAEIESLRDEAHKKFGVH